METKIIGIILLICAGLIFQYSYDEFMGAFFSPSVKLKSTIEKDITKSLEIQAPENKSKLHHVKFSYRSKDAHDFLKKHPPQFQTNKSGTIWLEVEVLDLPDEENPGFITQTSIFDLKTKNKIGEFGETYYIKDFDKNTKIRLMAKTTPAETKEVKAETNKKNDSKKTPDSKPEKNSKEKEASQTSTQKEDSKKTGNKTT